MISIITPIYNATIDNLDLTIKSLYRQTDMDFEWITIFDGQVDYSPEDAGVSKNAPFKTKWAILENNYGPSVARNIGFQISDGDIIAYADIGDIVDQDRVKHIHEIFSKYKIDLLFDSYTIEDVKLVDNVPTRVRYHFDHMKNMDIMHIDAHDYLNILYKQNITIPLGVSHIRKPFVEVGGFQRGIVCGEDGILWRRMVDKIDDRHKIMFTDSIAGVYIVNPDGQSRTQRRFEMGGFAFDGDKRDNGRYLDVNWFQTYNSKGLYD